MNERRLILDEREMNVFRRVCTTLYIITLFSLIGMQLYRQFVLSQSHQEWEDIAILITVNVVVLLGSLLYLGGGFNPKKIRLRYLIAGYLGFVLVGLVFTIYKYAVLLKQTVGLTEILEYFCIVLVISGILFLGWGVIAYLGSRRLDRQIEE
jgi:hypothetical protein